MYQPSPALPPSEPLSQPVSSSIMKKLGFVFLVFVVLQIPLLMINGVIEERQNYNVSYPKQYKGPGAAQQTITGPVLTIPYHYQTTEERSTPASNTTNTADNNSAKSKQNDAGTRTIKVTKTDVGYIHIFPDALNVKGSLIPEIRDEGRFKSILYSTALDFKGTFNTADLAAKKIAEKDLLWQDAFLALGISDLRGIRNQTKLDWAGQNYKFIPGVNNLKLVDAGQHVPLKNVQPTAEYPFAFTLQLNGSRDLNIFPAGKENKISLSSSWPEPTFTGGFLPTQKTVNKQGFNSQWEVSYFSRNLPQVWTDTDPSIKNSLAQYMVGVTLATPVEFYRTAIRAIKYGNLFIIMTFLTFFIFEIITKLRIHEIQYLLVGAALCLFFLMLTAISEWIPFVWAYVFASVPTIAQIT
jgi:inner membrane protein